MSLAAELAAGRCPTHITVQRDVVPPGLGQEIERRLGRELLLDVAVSALDRLWHEAERAHLLGCLIYVSERWRGGTVAWPPCCTGRRIGGEASGVRRVTA